MNLAGQTTHWVENVENRILKFKMRICTVEFRKLVGYPEIKHKGIFLVLQFTGRSGRKQMLESMLFPLWLFLRKPESCLSFKGNAPLLDHQ